ncbi:MAG: HAMP domain-containing sensor histidine kinase [Phycisphaeraceae bacterium]
MAEAEAPTEKSSPVTTPITLRYSLQRKVALWTLTMVIVPTLLCALWLNGMAHAALTETHYRNVSNLTQAVATALTARLNEGWTPQAQQVLDALFLERRLAFVVITDPKERVLHRRSIDTEAWSQFTRQTGLSGVNGAIDVDQVMSFGESGETIVRRTPIFNPPNRTDVPRSLEGFVLLGLRETSLPDALSRLRWTQFLAAGVVCALSLPLVLLAVRRWTAPLKALMLATVRLGQGEDPPPVPVTSHDELGQLGHAFNDMASKLSVAHRDLRAANEDLERKVVARTAQLNDANDRLEAEIREKNEFLRAVSHDLGAPLRNIDGMAGMLLAKYKSQLADDALSKLERISANAKVQIDLLNDLMELSRIRTRPGKREEVDLHRLVDEVRTNLCFDLEANRITMEIQGTLPTIHAERNRMRQVFQNLLDNAVKYMLDAKDRLITVGFTCDERAVKFFVRDTGRGISKEDQPHVFDVFRRAQHSGSHHVAGRGVGLASVKAIVECYGGRIWLESELGKGTTIHFTLDAKQVGHDREKEPDEEWVKR